MPQRRFERDPAIVTRRIGDEIVLVPVRSSTGAMSEIFALNETAALVWNALAQPQSVDELSSLMTHEFAIDIGQAQADIAELLDMLIEAQVIREVL
jgi:hypothetical protein